MLPWFLLLPNSFCFWPRHHLFPISILFFCSTSFVSSRAPISLFRNIVSLHSRELVLFQLPTTRRFPFYHRLPDWITSLTYALHSGDALLEMRPCVVVVSVNFRWLAAMGCFGGFFFSSTSSLTVYGVRRRLRTVAQFKYRLGLALVGVPARTYLPICRSAVPMSISVRTPAPHRPFLSGERKGTKCE